MGSRKQKWLALILIAVLAVTATTGGVYAYLSATAGSVENTFTAATAPLIAIEETFQEEGNKLVKRDVRVDVGSPGYAVYVRAAIVVTWKNETGQVYGQLPVDGVDYSINLNTVDNVPWFYNSADGFYYLKAMVTSGETEVLINSCCQTAPAPESGYTLHVEIVAQTIQALGTTDNGNIPAVTDAWGVSVDTATKQLTL